MRLPFAVGLTALSGGLYGLCFPTASVQLLAWVVLVPFFVALRGVRLGVALGLGWVWTITAAYAVGDWFPSSVAAYYRQPLAIGIAFFFGVSSLMAAPYYMAFAAWYRAIGRGSGPWLSLLVAAAWTAAELGRSRLFTGNPWALLGYSQVGVDALVQIADVTGVYGVTFMLAVVNAALAETWLAGARSRRRASMGLVLAGAVVAIVLGYGRLRMAALAGSRGTPIEVALIQGNLDLGTQWREEFYGRNLDVYLRLTQAALEAHRPALVVWPENSLTFFLETEPHYRAAIARVLQPSSAQLLAGGPRAVGRAHPLYYNSMFLLSPDGTILGHYDKQRLVPFAEYFPIRAIDVLRRRFGRIRELTPGRPSPPLPTVAGLAGITICNEAMFPEVAAERVREGAVFFVDPAHDTWLTPKFSAQQFDIVRLRTIEQRRFLIRASTSGPSAIVDPLGRLRARSEFLARAAVVGTIEARDDVTLYGRLGDVFASLCALAALIAWGTRMFPLRRHEV